MPGPESETGAVASTHPASSFSSVSSSSTLVCAGGARVHLTPADGLVRALFALETPVTMDFSAADVTAWCAETSVLMRVTFELSGDDEVRVRAPMLVDRRGAALAFVRSDSTRGSEVVIALAETTQDLARENYSFSVDVTSEEARTLVMALESAAVAATSSRAGL